VTGSDLSPDDRYRGQIAFQRSVSYKSPARSGNRPPKHLNVSQPDGLNRYPSLEYCASAGDNSNLLSTRRSYSREPQAWTPVSHTSARDIHLLGRSNSREYSTPIGPVRSSSRDPEHRAHSHTNRSRSRDPTSREPRDPRQSRSREPSSKDIRRSRSRDTTGGHEQQQRNKRSDSRDGQVIPCPPRNRKRSESLLNLGPPISRSSSFTESSPRAHLRRGSLRVGKVKDPGVGGVGGRRDARAEQGGRGEAVGHHEDWSRPDNKLHQKMKSETCLQPANKPSSLFPNFENIKEALFGETKPSMISPIRHRNKGESPVKDEFTEFSQYGSRYTLHQVDEKGKDKKEGTKDKEEKDNTEKGEKSKSQDVPGGKDPGKASQDQATARAQPTTNQVQAPARKQTMADKLSGKLVGGFLSSSKQHKLSSDMKASNKPGNQGPPPPPMSLGQAAKGQAGQAAQRLPGFSIRSPVHPGAGGPPPGPPGPPPGHLMTGPAPTTRPTLDPRFRLKPRAPLRSNVKLKSVVSKSDSDSGYGEFTSSGEPRIKQVDIESEYDLIQLIGEGWISKVYLAENRSSRGELVLKAINSNLVTSEEFYREYQNSVYLSAHRNVLRIYDRVFQSEGFFIFSTEYAPLGDLTSNISENGLGELYTKRVASQIGSALDFIHTKNVCHLNVKLDNILVFRSDFSLVKLCDFGSVRTTGDIVMKKNEHLPYCPPELVARHTNEYYQVDRVQDVFQFGIVVFFCLLGILPWQKADPSDPNFNEFTLWRRKKSNKIPRHFKSMTARAQKLFRKVLDPDPDRRIPLEDINKYIEDRWIRKGGKPVTEGRGGDHQSQLTLGSFQSVHSNAVEKNRMLYTLLQHGVETTVDRSQKTHRIISWIKQGAEREDNISPVCQNFPHEYIPEEIVCQENRDDVDVYEGVDIDD